MVVYDSMAKKPATLEGIALADLEPSPEHIALVRDEVARLGRQQKVWLGILNSLEAAAGEPLTLVDLRQAAKPRESSLAAPSAEVAPPPAAPAFDGTLGGLVAAFRTHPKSAYQEVRHTTRMNYESLMRRLVQDCGAEKIADLKAEHIDRFYEGWKAGGKIAMGHSMIGILRTVIYFGVNVLADPDCERFAVPLHRKRAEMPKKRSQSMTVTHAKNICATARQLKYNSIALCQALQFDCGLRQKDVVGEWVPLSEPVDSDVKHGDEKWIRGLLWSQIDDDLILRHTTSFGAKKVEVDLHNAPLVMAELERLGERPKKGPVIVSEDTDLPYQSYEFRRLWRSIANDAGVPKDVRNSDSRAGNREPSSDDALDDDDEPASVNGDFELAHDTRH